MRGEYSTPALECAGVDRDAAYEPGLQVAEIMLTFVTVNVAPLPALALGPGCSLDGTTPTGTNCSATPSCPSRQTCAR